MYSFGLFSYRHPGEVKLGREMEKSARGTVLVKAYSSRGRQIF